MIRVRTVRRVPEARRWDAAAVRGIRALPRQPTPIKESEKQEVEPELAQGTEPAPREEGGVVRFAVDAAVPADFVGIAVAIVLAVGPVVTLVVGHLVVQCVAIVRIAFGRTGSAC